MVEKSIIEVIKHYLSILPQVDLHPTKAVVFGSQVTGNVREHSDIDLVIIAPEFDEDLSMAPVKRLWRATKYADSRIEPIPCGVKEWEDGSDRLIIDIARREGVVIEG